jgi:dihydrofolate reductase
MRKLIHFVHTSLDGYINGPGGAFDWPVLGPELAQYAYDLEDRSDAMLYGRVVWEMMSSYWPNADEVSDDPHDRTYAPRWRKARKLVISRTLDDDLGWGARVIGRTDLAGDVAALKAEPGTGDLLLMGGSVAAAALTGAGLVDEYHVGVQPVVLGGGQPLFAPGVDRLHLELIGSTPCDGRTVVLQYRRA